MDGHEDEDLFAEDERYKTALHYTIGKLSQKAVVDRTKAKRFKFGRNSQSPPVKFTKEFVAMLTDVTWSMNEHWAKDLEAFASHAKRSVINADDVRLLVRRSPSLIKSLEEAAHIQSATSATGSSTSTETTKRGKKRSSNETTHKNDSPLSGGPNLVRTKPTDEETISSNATDDIDFTGDDIDAAILMMNDTV